MNMQVRLLLLSSLLATLVGVLSNVVANYLPAVFEGRRWLAVGLFAVVILLWLAVELYQRGLWSPFGATIPGLDRATRRQLLALLTPWMRGENERRALLELAIGGTPLYHQIDYSGADEPFTLNLLRTLAADKLALSALLQVIGSRVGADQQAQIQNIQTKIQQAAGAQPTPIGVKFAIGALMAGLALTLWFVAPWAGDRVAEAAPSCPAARICIAIAPFKPPDDPAAREATDQVEQAIRQIFRASERDRFVVRRLEQAVNDSEQAQAQALAEADLLLVWGQLFTTQGDPPPLTVNFEFADPLGVEAQSTSPYRALPLQPLGDNLYCTQCLGGAATQQAEIVAHMTAGLAHYVRGQPRRARLDFTAALYCAGEIAWPTLAGSPPPTCTPVNSNTEKLSLLYYYLGKAYFLEGDYPNALTYLEQAAQRNPQDLATLVGRAATNHAWQTVPDAAADPQIIQLGINADALILQAQRIAADLYAQAPPDLAPVIDFDLALLYEVMDELEEAQTAYRQAVNRFGEQRQTGRYVALIGLARAQEKADQRDDARATLKRAHDLAPFFPWAYLALARLDAADRPQAEAWLAQAELLVAPDEAIIDVTQAELCTQWQDYACAAQAYQQAVDKQPENGRIYSLVGNFYLPDLHSRSDLKSLKSWDLAAWYYRQVADVLRPQDPWAHQRLAYVLQNSLDDAGAIAHYQAAIERLYPPMQTTPSDLIAGLYCNLGVSQERSGQQDAAQQSYEQCAQLAVTDAQRAHARSLRQGVEE